MSGMMRFMAAAEQVRTFEVIAERSSPWWLLRVPELEIVSQARWWGEAESTARDLIATWLDVPIETVAVNLVRSPVPADPPASWWIHLRVWADVARVRLLQRQRS